MTLQLRVHVTRIGRLENGGVLLSRLFGLPHQDHVRNGQPWLYVRGFEPRQIAGWRGLLESRGLPDSMYEVVGPKEEVAEAERIYRECLTELEAVA